jgi:Bacterial Ig-like domain (group 3)
VPKHFSSRLWLNVGSIALVLAVASTLMLGGCSLWGLGTSAARGVLNSQRAPNFLGSHGRIDSSVPHSPDLDRDASSLLSRVVFDFRGKLVSNSANYYSYLDLGASAIRDYRNPYVIEAFPDGGSEGGASTGRASTTTLASSATSINSGQSVTLTVTVKPTSGTGTPTGTVTFLDGTAKLDSKTLNSSGIAIVTTTALSTIGAHSITAAYGGDSNFAASTSDPVAVSVSGLDGLPARVPTLVPRVNMRRGIGEN